MTQAIEGKFPCCGGPVKVPVPTSKEGRDVYHHRRTCRRCKKRFHITILEMMTKAQAAIAERFQLELRSLGRTTSRHRP